LTSIVGPVAGEVILTEGSVPLTTETLVDLITEGLPSTGFVSTALVIGSRVYGMVGSLTYAGKDEPFCYDLSTSAFVSISGVSSGLLPTSPATAGDWTPPTMAAVTNSTILVTHPGFAGGSSPFFGWIDTSGFSSTVMKGNLTTGSPVIRSIYSTVGISDPILQGVQPGQAISGTGIPAGAYVISATTDGFTLSTQGDTVTGIATLTNVHSLTGVEAGMLITGPGIPAGAYIVSVDSATQVTMSANATATANNVALVFSGGGTITMSANATATANIVALTLTGGTSAAPRWGAGNTNTNPLALVPTCTYGFNGRAYYGVGPYLVYSDPLNPMQVSLASQALVIGDSTSITALAGLPLTSQLTGGVQQSMTVFKGAGPVYQVTGDAATSDLTQAVVNGSIGTLAPNTIAATPYGLAFIAIDGLRILQLSGTLSNPLGANGEGVATPFLNALYPSRMCAAYGESVYRVTVQDASVAGNPTYEYWLDIDAKEGGWTGPHTFPASFIAAWPAGVTFLMAPYGILGSLWQSDAIPRYDSVFVENGVRLQCRYTTSLLPDNQEGALNRVTQASLTAALASADTMLVSVIDDNGSTIGTSSFNGRAASSSTWGGGTWGTSVWGTGLSPLREYALRFEGPLFFRQASVDVSFGATSGQGIGNLYAKIQTLGLNVPYQY